MRYHISGKIRPGKKKTLTEDVRIGSVAEGAIFHGGMMAGLRHATMDEEGRVHFIEVCYCLESGLEPMQMELPYLEDYFDALKVKDARRRKKCTMECEACDCTRTYRLPGSSLADRLGLNPEALDGDFIDPGRIPLNRKRQGIGIQGLRDALRSGAEAWFGDAAVKGLYALFRDREEWFRVKEVPDTKEARALLRKSGLTGLGSVEGARRAAKRNSVAERDDKSNIV